MKLWEYGPLSVEHGILQKMSFWQRVGSFLRFMFYANWFVLRNGGKYDLCIASSGPLTMAVPALLGKFFYKLPYVFEVIDVWPDSAIDAGALKNRFLQWIAFLLEEWTYRYSSAIVTCSTGMTDRIVSKLQGKKNITPEHCGDIDAFSLKTLTLGSKIFKVQTISNGCDLDLFNPDANEKRDVRREFEVSDDKLVVLYSGAMGVSNQVDDLIEAIKETRMSSGIVWWLAGDGIRAGELKALEKQGQVRFFGQLSKIDVARLYKGADINLVTFLHTPLFFENSPNKFFDGIAAGLPAIFNRSTWLTPWLTKYGCGIVCDVENPTTSIALELSALSEDRQRLKEMSRGARRLAEDVFDRDLLVGLYTDVLFVNI